MGESDLTRTLTICPDPACQAKVEADIAAGNARLEAIRAQKLEREQASKQRHLGLTLTNKS
jgi:hypothetical protein